MAYDTGKPFSYGIPDGTYVGRPTTASCFEKDGRLILDVSFAVKDPATGQFYTKENGYEWEAKKRYWLTSRDGAFNERTLQGIREWAKRWNPASFDDFYWFQSPDANGTPFGNLTAIGEVKLNFQKDGTGAQQLWVHDPNRAKGASRKAYVPDGASADKAALMAKWGTKAKALFAATPKRVATAGEAAARPGAAPARPSQDVEGVQPPASAPARPAGVSARPQPASGPLPWAAFEQTSDGAFAYYCSLLGEPYQGAKHDEKWFDLYDQAADGKDPDQLDARGVQRLFKAVHDGMAR